MALSYTFEGPRDLPVKQMAGDLAALSPEKVNPILARAASNHTRQHLFGLDSSRANLMGGRRSHFYGQAARSTQFGAAPDSFFVSIDHVGFRQRLEGGTIRPVKAKMLTIPATAEAYGHRAREFNNLRFALLKGIPALVQSTSQRIGYRRPKGSAKGSAAGKVTKGKVIPDKVMFWLARSVYQGPDPNVLPTEQDFDAVLSDRLDKYAARIEARQGRQTEGAE